MCWGGVGDGGQVTGIALSLFGGGGAVSATKASIARRLDNLFEKTAQHAEPLHAKA